MRWTTAIALAALVACGGKAVVDGEPGNNGGGGSQPAGSGGTSVVTTGVGASGSQVASSAVGSSVVATTGTGGGPVNGCTIDTAENHLGEMQVFLTWSNPFQRCIRIGSGSLVTWSGSFANHPLAGGVAPTVDAGSPITQSDQSGMSASVSFMLGVYPFFCQIHTATMQGVIYVE
jgi:hypothetical protein